MKILLKNLSKGWFSLATHMGVRVELKVNATKILDIEDAKFSYYKQFIPLGIAIEVLKDANVEEEVKDDCVHIDDMTDPEIKDEGITKVECTYEGLSEKSLNEFTKAQLRDLCDSLSINYTSKMLKKDLINLLLTEFPEGD